MPPAGIHSVTVPGAVDGWAKMHAKFGKLPWRDLFAPAIYYAEHGFPVTEIIQYDWAGEASTMRKEPSASRIFPGRTNVASENTLELPRAASRATTSRLAGR